MTTVSKCLVVFVVAASLAFLGFASAVLQGGPNYQSQLKDPMLNGYIVETTKVKKRGKTTHTYTVTTRRPQQDAEGNWSGEVLEQDSPVLTEVIIAARKHLKGEQEKELEQIRRVIDGYEENGQKVPGLQDQITRAINEIEEDKKAFTKRETFLVAELGEIQKGIGKVTELAQNETAKAEQLQLTATRRREDVFRLKNQMEELKTDIFRAEKQRETLEDLLIRVQSKVQRLERRNKQLRYD